MAAWLVKFDNCWGLAAPGVVMIGGGGWPGCAAALTAKAGAGKVTLAERTGMLLGTGLVGGIMLNNRRGRRITKGAGVQARSLS